MVSFAVGNTIVRTVASAFRLPITRSRRLVMSTVTAYAATSATEPLTKTTITRREVGPHDVAIDINFAGICHSDIHTVKGEWGVVEYPDGARPRDRRRGHRGRLRGHQVQGGRPRRRGLLRGLLPRVRATVGPARSSTAQSGHGRHLQRRRQRRHGRPRAATAARSSSTRTTCCASPTALAAGRGGAAAVRGHHAVLAAAALEGRPGHAGRGHRPGRPRATWASSWRTRWAPR